MVDDIHFPKGLPPVSASRQVQRVNRKKRDDDKPPFEKYLNADEKKDKKKGRKKKKSDSVDVTGKTEKDQSLRAVESSSSDDASTGSDEVDQKIIDVRV